MRRNSKMHIYLSVLLISFAACKKNPTPTPEAETPVVVAPPIVATPNPPVTPTTPSYEVGTGVGNLTIDGKSLDFTTIKLIKIKAGSYQNISIININGTSAQPISIVNNGQVKITESLSTENVANILILGDYTAGIAYGFSFENISYRAITLKGRINGITLKSMSFKNVADYVIAGNSGNDGALKYIGTAETRSENLKILNSLFDNTGTITFGGSLNKDNAEDSGFFKTVEIGGNIFQNSPGAGSVVSFSNVQDYDIHHNTVNNINQSNNNHNGVFFMQGNGKFHDNKLTNYQGNSIRMWLYSRGSSPATNEIYNNVCYNTRKYGAFELQMFDRNIYSGKSTYANAKVYNNTAGTLDTSHGWEGQMLDLYNTGGTLEYYNNLGFNMYSSAKPISNMINNMNSTRIIKEENNKYVAAQSDAVNNTTNFTSLFPGVGAPGF